MQVKLIYGEQARLWEGTTKNIQAYDFHYRGADCFFRLNEKDNKQARQFFQQAINIDKAYVSPHVLLGFTHLFDMIYGWSKSPIESFVQAEKCAEHALAINDSYDGAHMLLGWIYLFKRQHDKAIKEGERAIELNPNGALAHATLAYILCMSDNAELAIKLLYRAIRLNPIPPPHFYLFLAIAFGSVGAHEEAIKFAEKSLIGNSDQIQPYISLAASYSSLNRIHEAQHAAEEILRIDPNFSLEYLAKTVPYKNQETLDKVIDALRKAGLPE
jgi:adenylate cyclase